MEKYVPAECIELFHLYFLEQLSLIMDKNLYVLKGGCNLRFFFKSIRYSQDIDIDIKTIRLDTLVKKVRKILDSINTKRFLQFHDMEIASFSEPKQTQTTQRFKLSLKSSLTSVFLNTKIEFSRRGITDEINFETIDPIIAAKYQLNPFFINHYSAKSAYKQKIKALIGRNKTQARDIFDLFHLISLNTEKYQLNDLEKKEIEKIVLSVSFEDFKSQVIAYLPFEYHKQYNDPLIWKKVVIKIMDETAK